MSARVSISSIRRVSFPSGNLTLLGWLHRPKGAGPFPAIIWNHGSEQYPGSFDALAAYYTAAGYVLFVPHRRGHGRSPGEYPLEGVRRRAATDRSDPGAYHRRIVELVVELHEKEYLDDTVAAVRWLERQPFIDSSRMAMSGVSHGAIQTLVAARAHVGLRVKAYMPFAPAAMAWPTSPEVRRWLLNAVKKAAAPMFLIQAENDYSLGPAEVLGAEINGKGGLNRTGVYPAYGGTRESGHAAFASLGMDVWGNDVCEFLDEVFTRSTHLRSERRSASAPADPSE